VEELIGYIVWFVLHIVISYIGAALRWVFSLGRQSFKALLEKPEDNFLVGFTTIFLSFTALYLYFIFRIYKRNAAIPV
jgi:hypothetical protein